MGKIVFQAPIAGSKNPVIYIPAKDAVNLEKGAMYEITLIKLVPEKPKGDVVE